MLSVLIPVYNRDVVDLVKVLQRLCRQEKVIFEILCIDDGSAESLRAKNRSIQALEHVRYIELPQNTGRAAIRNRLAKEARFESLIFLDCDVAIPRENFIRSYLDCPPNTVIYGGRASMAKPEDPDLILHWKYGESREVQAVTRRRKKPYLSFMTSNFMIARKLLLQYPFDERISEYGHEDSCFAASLRSAGVPIRHIDNPVLHLGLVPALEFIVRSKQAVNNLVHLQRMGIQIPSRLNSLGQSLIKLNCDRLFARSVTAFERHVTINLRSTRPVLILLDLLKLKWWITAYRKLLAKAAR